MGCCNVYYCDGKIFTTFLLKLAYLPVSVPVPKFSLKLNFTKNTCKYKFSKFNFLVFSRHLPKIKMDDI
jgi:hypothetical protein